MKLSQLRIFLAVLEAKSFSEAGLELGLSQAAVSYAVAELEKELDLKLLERGRFGARPTAFGTKVEAHARSILQSEAAILQEADAQRGVIAGTLRVAVFRSAAGRLLPGMMVSLRKRHPKLNVQLIELDYFDSEGRNKEQLVREHRADIAFTENPNAVTENDDLMVWELTRDPYLALVTQDDPRTQLNWKALNEESFIFSECIYCSGQVQSRLESLEETFAPSYRVREDSTILRMVSQGLGVSVLPELAIDELPDNVKVLPLEVRLERSICVAILPSSLKIPAVRVFLNALKAQFPESGIPRLSTVASQVTST